MLFRSKKLNNTKLNNIIIVSAILARYGAKGHQIYSASKAALDGLMRSLAVELAPRIKVNSILPGGVKTPLTIKTFEDPDILRKAILEYPLGLGTTSDISNVVQFLISDSSRWITGQEIVVDGGRTINISHK